MTEITCKYCGGITFESEGKHFCKQLNCPLWYKPQEWYSEVELPDGVEAIIPNDKLDNFPDGVRVTERNAL